jgi:hypothetical protein
MYFVVSAMYFVTRIPQTGLGDLGRFGPPADGGESARLLIQPG